MTYSDVCIILNNFINSYGLINDFDVKLNNTFGYVEVEEINNSYDYALDTFINITICYLGYGANFDEKDSPEGFWDICADIFFCLINHESYVIYDDNDNQKCVINNIEEYIDYISEYIDEN